MALASKIIQASHLLADELRNLHFSAPVSHTYLTLDYASDGNHAYLEKFAQNKKRILFLGMNPGPYGMAQTGVPFGEITAVRNWMGLNPLIGKPTNEHPKRRIDGMACPRSEVSGRRLWGLFSEKFPNPGDFFKDHLVLNFCPLFWMKDSGANLTPDKLPTHEMAPVDAACQQHLSTVIELLEPKYLIGVGAYAEQQLIRAIKDFQYPAKIAKILHPSPASPAANRGWAKAAEAQLLQIGCW